MAALNTMHQLNLLSFVYKNIAMQYNAPNLGIGMAMAFTFKQAAKMLSDHLLMHEARKALHALQKVGNTNTDALQRTGRGNRGGASHMQNIISSKGMTGYPMPGDASDSASERELLSQITILFYILKHACVTIGKY